MFNSLFAMRRGTPNVRGLWSWRFRPRKTGICGWSTPGSDAAKVVLLGEVLKLWWRGPTPPLRVTSPLCATKGGRLYLVVNRRFVPIPEVRDPLSERGRL